MAAEGNLQGVRARGRRGFLGHARKPEEGVSPFEGHLRGLGIGLGGVLPRQRASRHISYGIAKVGRVFKFDDCPDIAGNAERYRRILGVRTA